LASTSLHERFVATADGGRIPGIKHPDTYTFDFSSRTDLSEDEISAAIAALNVGDAGGLIVLPPGDVSITKPLTPIETSGLHLTGAGRSTTNLVVDPARFEVPSTKDPVSVLSAADVTGLTLSNLGVTGHRWRGARTVAAERTHYRLIDLTTAHETTLDNVHIRNIPGTALKLVNCWDSTFLNCFFQSSGQPQSDTPAVVISSLPLAQGEPPESSQGASNNVEFIGTFFQGSRYVGLRIMNRARKTRIVGCKFEGPASGTGIFSHVEIDNAYQNIVTGSTIGRTGSRRAKRHPPMVDIHNGSQANVINGCNFSGNRGVAVSIDGSDGNAISGCAFGQTDDDARPYEIRSGKLNTVSADNAGLGGHSAGPIQYVWGPDDTRYRIVVEDGALALRVER
jgi:hypothetical protein